MRLQSWAQLNSNEQQKPVITLKAHLSWNQPHFKCSVATGGRWLPEWTVGLRPPPCSPPKAVYGVGTGSARLVTLLRGGEQMTIKSFTIRERALGLPLHVSTPHGGCTPSHPQFQSLPFSAAFPSCSAESPAFFIAHLHRSSVTARPTSLGHFIKKIFS